MFTSLVQDKSRHRHHLPDTSSSELPATTRVALVHHRESTTSQTSQMPSTPAPLRSLRKPAETYSLTVDSDSFTLTLPHSMPVATIRTPPLPPQKLPSEESYMHNYTYPSIASSSRLYVPHIHVPRGPRARNLYLYPPTEADYLKSQQRSIAKAGAIEDARIEREDDERRRTIALGIPPPRKSTRRIKSSANVTTELEGVLVAADKSPSLVEQGYRKRRRAIVKKKSIVQFKPVFGDASASPSGLLSSSSIPPETAPPPHKPRRKAPKSNPRPTQRLTTRSLANLKAKTNALGGGESTALTVNNVSSEMEDLEAMDLDIETQGAEIGTKMNSARSTLSPHNPQKVLTHENPKMADDQLDPVELLQHSDNRASLSSDSSLPSSETLFDDVEINLRDLSKEAVFPGSTDIHAIKSSLSIGSNTSGSLTGHSVSLSAGHPSLPATVVTNDQIAKKRKSEEMDTDLKPSMQCRRSSRIPKKRKLQ